MSADRQCNYNATWNVRACPEFNVATCFQEEIWN